MGHVKAFLPNEQHTSVCTIEVPYGRDMLKPYQMSNTHRYVPLRSPMGHVKAFLPNEQHTSGCAFMFYSKHFKKCLSYIS